ncbi:MULTISPECIES: NUDIX hydrolase [unclassified Exiguobacterium]|uniref:NUDIX hydrolase n=1 Tax=unclassified Exiguobacterium TaxID=2644629 RepID=UPI001BE83A1C
MEQLDINFKFEKQRFNHRAAAVIVKEGCLLIHRNIRDAFWALPGGRIQLMESGETAVVREIKEELGLEAQVKRFLCVHENFFTYEDVAFHEVGFYYEVELLDEINVTTEDFYGVEGEELIYRFVPIDELPSIEFYPLQLKTMLKTGEWDRLIKE